MTIASKLNAEIISADSRQIYKEFDICTAKISESEMGGIRHYLIDVLEPGDEFSAGGFVDMAKNAIDEICKKGKNPILVGGTGLYLKMLLDGIDMPKGEPDLKLRAELDALCKEKGSQALYDLLCKLDEEFAQNIHPNDTYKIMRSIEILKQTNLPMKASRGLCEKKYDVLKIGLSVKNREFLYNRINKRVDLMMNAGLEEEARRLFLKYPNCKAYENTIGYKEFIPYFKGEVSLLEAVDKIKQNTRRYAKRQLTWFRAQEEIHWFYIDETSQDEIERSVLELCRAFLA